MKNDIIELNKIAEGQINLPNFKVDFDLLMA